MKLVGCRGCGNLVGSRERRCPFCGVAMAMPSSRLVGTVLAGLMLGGCADKIDAVLDTDADASDTDKGSSSDPYVDPPSSEATYGVPVTDSDWYGTGSSGESSSSGEPPGSEASGTESESDSDTDSDSDSDSGSDSDSDSGSGSGSGSDSGSDSATATDSASSDDGR
jgi:hypothetical protein